MQNNNDIKLTVIVRLISGGDASQKAISAAAAEAARIGCPYEVIKWDVDSGEMIEISAIKGAYFNIIDDSDRWENHSLAKLVSFLDKHADSCDCAFAYRKVAKAKKRPLEDRRIAKAPPQIIDIEAEYEKINTLFKGALIRTDAVRQAIREIAPGGDSETLCVMAAALSRMKYAVITAAVIRYTEIKWPHREKGDEKTVAALFELARKIRGGIPRYVQSIALECLYFSLKKKETDLRCLSEIGADVIERSSINRRAKEYIIEKKYGEGSMTRTRFDESGVVYLDGERIADISKGEGIKVSILDVKDGMLFADGLVFSSVISSARLILTDGAGKDEECEILAHPPEDVETRWGERIASGERYRVNIKLEKGRAYGFVLDDGNGVRVKLIPFMGSHSRVNGEARHSYFVKGGYRIVFSEGRLHVSAAAKSGNLKAEIKYLMEIARRREFGVIFYRLLCRIRGMSKRKPIWLVGDRSQFAKDNAEHLFRFLMQSDAKKHYDIRFVIEKNSRDYERMKSYGRVLPFDTVAHRVIFLLADKIILSTAHVVGTNPFSTKRPFYQDLYDFGYVYLRHGVSQHDQSRWLNKLNKNINLLISAGRREYEALISGDYCYDASVVKLTGLPRYDNLTDAAERVIAVLPTWRKSLEGKMLPASQKRKYRSDFKTSAYFGFYNALINDTRLIAAMHAGGYKGKFYLHPVFEAQAGDFTNNDVFEIGTSVADYQQVFRESSLLLTDYSSVAFDFAYLKKPVVYAQHDFDDFYNDHSWERGYFSYGDDGFGPVARSYDQSVEALVSYIEGGCVMEDRYRQRVDDFFAFTDRENCRRVFEAIEAMGDGE